VHLEFFEANSLSGTNFITHSLEVSPAVGISYIVDKPSGYSKHKLTKLHLTL